MKKLIVICTLLLMLSACSQSKSTVQETTYDPSPSTTPSPTITVENPTPIPSYLIPLKDSSNDSANTLTDDEKIIAWAIVKMEVEAQLKSPSTAKFPTFYDAGYSKEGSLIVVYSYVDAENSFGAMMRQNFFVSYERTGKTSYKNAEVIFID